MTIQLGMNSRMIRSRIEDHILMTRQEIIMIINVFISGEYDERLD